MEDDEAESTQFKAYVCPNPSSNSNLSSRKQRLLFLEINRDDPYSVMDTCKVADLLICVMSCKNTNVSGVKQDPFAHSKAIDEVGYRALSLVRSQGMPSLVGVLQHVEAVGSSKQSYVKKLFQRIFVSEFTDKYKFMCLNSVTDTQISNDSGALLRQIAVQFPAEVSWKENRSYMLGEVAHRREDEVHIKGYIRQNYLNAKRLIHVTGLPVLSWKIKRIELASDPTPLKLSQKEKDQAMSTSKAQSIVSSRKSSRRTSFDGAAEMKEESKDPNTGTKCVQAGAALGEHARDSDQIENNPGLFAAEQTWPTEDEMSKARQRKLSDAEEMQEMDTGELNIGSFKVEKAGQAGELNELFEKMQIAVVGREGEDGASNGADDEDEESESEIGDAEEELKYMEHDPNTVSQKHAKHTDLETRAQEDMDFPDEVDTPEQAARARFQKYRGIKSLKNCDWDPFENLPQEYSRIWRFQNFQAAQKDAVAQAVDEGLPLNGTYVTIVLEIAEGSGNSSLFTPGQAVILSTLFPHECKLSTMHFKLKRTIENTEPIASRTNMELHCGFRRMQVQPVFSAETNPGSPSEKLKFLRFLRSDIGAVATVICPIVFAPCKVLCFTEKSLQSKGTDIIAATGLVMPPNPLKVILKRIILTGYPLRCHKKKGVIRYMFFEPKDIKYFKPVELYTKHGLKGHIRASLGTHGLMKCTFNDFLKQDDVVCMPLYRRVFPAWFERSWNPNAALPVKNKNAVYDAEAEK